MKHAISNLISSIQSLYGNINSPYLVVNSSQEILWSNKFFENLTSNHDEQNIFSDVFSKENTEKFNKNNSVNIKCSSPIFENLEFYCIPVLSEPLLVLVNVVEQTGNQSFEQASITDHFNKVFRNLISQNDSIISFLSRNSDIDESVSYKYLNSLSRNNFIMLKNIKNISTLSSLQNNILTCNPIEQNFTAYITDLMKSTEALLSHQTIPLTSKISPANIKMCFDPELITKVITSILSNSFIYTRDYNKVHFDYTVHENKVEIRIIDLGIGIQADYLKNIFTPYFIDNNGYSSNGIGASLAICKKIIDLHSGTISVTSSFGEGTTVLIELPIKNNFEPPEKSKVLQLNSFKPNYIQNRFSELFVNFADICTPPL